MGKATVPLKPKGGPLIGAGFVEFLGVQGAKPHAGGSGVSPEIVSFPLARSAGEGDKGGEGSRGGAREDDGRACRQDFSRTIGTLGIVSGLALVAFAARLYQLTFQSLWWDEGDSLYQAGLDWAALIWGKDFALDPHPPLYYLLLSWWSSFAGFGVFAARFLSLWLGVLGVPLIYQLGRQLWGPAAGIWAAGLLAVSPAHIFYSQEARMYSLLPLWALAAFWAAARLVERGPGWRSDWWAYAASVAAGLYTHYHFGLLWMALNLWFAVFWRRDRRAWGRWAGAQAAVLLLYLPWLWRLAPDFVLTEHWQIVDTSAAAGDLGAFLRDTWLAFSVGFAFTPPWTWLFALAFLSLTVWGALAPGWREGNGRWLVALGLAAPVALAYLVSLRWPFYYPRFVLYGAMLAYLLAGVGLAALFPSRWRWLAVALGGVLFASSLYSLSFHYTVPRTAYSLSDYLTLLPDLRELARPGDLVLTSQLWQVGYLRGYLPTPRPELRAATARWLGDAEALDRELAENLRRHRRIWVMSWLAPAAGAQNPLEEALGRRGAQARFSDRYGDTRLRLYALGHELVSPPGLAARPVEMGGGQIAFLGHRLTGAEGGLRPGQRLSLALYWRAQKPLTENYTVFTHLVGADGKIWAQHDGPPLGGTLPTTQWSPSELVMDRHTLVVNLGAPAGPAALQVGLYEATTGRRLAAGGADKIVLQELEIIP